MTVCKTSIFAWALTAMATSIVAQASDFQANARSAADQLMTLYDQSTGLWNDGSSPLWWNSANMLTAMVDLSSIDSTVKDKYNYIIATTYNNAPAANPHATRKRSIDGLYTKEYRARSDREIAERMLKRDGNGQGFLNGYYDDEGWWALAWIDAYDLTGNADYLSTAQQIWSDMKGGASQPCGAGGIWWDRKESYIASIANELFLATSASLANRVGASDKQQYVDAAMGSLSFFKSTGLLGSDNLIVDGLDKSTCQVQGTTFTYNQGVILGGLVELTRATGDSQYQDLAVTIANAATANGGPLVTNGILHEPNNCEQTNGCGNDGDQFKGVFVRNLKKLQKATGNGDYTTFFTTNAESIWNNDKTDTATLGPNWAGPYTGDGKAPAQCSALECISAAEATQ